MKKTKMSFKKLSYFLLLTLVISFVSCKDEFIEEVNNETIVKNEESFTIPLEEALQNLNSTLDVIELQELQNNAKGLYRATTKRKREIANVEVIYDNSPNNNGAMKAPNLKRNKLLYAVQFKGNRGGAVLSADKRIGNIVLAITENGNILEKQEPREYEQLFKAYPDFKFYNKELDDYYVGSLSPSFRNITLDICNNYAQNRFKRLNEDGTIEDVPNDFILYTTEAKPWQVVKKVGPLLTTTWNQRSPFNDATPLSRWNLFQDWKKGPAGCVPIAVAQIMAYHEYPNLNKFTPYSNWKEVKKIHSLFQPWNSGTSQSRYAVAIVVRDIGKECETFYTKKFAFAYPSDARDCMKHYGYKNVHRKKYYKTSVVVDMLKKGNPVFVAGISGWKDGHAWVVDGYIEREREIHKIKYTKTLAMKKYKKEFIDSWIETQTLIHCNFGWGGRCNGYYYSGIFNLKDGAVETESNEGDTGTKDMNYTWSFKTITYDNPNK